MDMQSSSLDSSSSQAATRRRREAMETLLLPPQPPPMDDEDDRGSSVFADDETFKIMSKEKSCSICYDRGVVSKGGTLTKTLRTLLLMNQDLDFCPFCLGHLEALVILKKDIERMENRLTSMTRGVRELILSAATPKDVLVSLSEESDQDVVEVDREEYILPQVGPPTSALGSSSSVTAAVTKTKNTNPFPCSLCDKRFLTLPGLRKHVQKKHEGPDKDGGPEKMNGIVVKIVSVVKNGYMKKTYTCTKCKKSFRARYKLKEHCESHSQAKEEKGKKKPKPFPCPDCPLSFLSKSALAVHFVIHLPEKERPYGCDACPRRFVVKALLERHAYSHITNLNLPLWWCALCQRGFEDKGGLERHEASQHNAYLKVVCRLCGGKFLNVTVLQNHQTLLHDNVVLP